VNTILQLSGFEQRRISMGPVSYRFRLQPRPERLRVTEHAQREACEAYIKSQAHEGWRLMCDKFDDGGLSGASLERPALQALLDEVRSGAIDIIVVYKLGSYSRYHCPHA
jgi:DNA invertase Pin-like site-specific DNA recombinase